MSEAYSVEEIVDLRQGLQKVFKVSTLGQSDVRFTVLNGGSYPDAGDQQSAMDNTPTLIKLTGNNAEQSHVYAPPLREQQQLEAVLGSLAAHVNECFPL